MLAALYLVFSSLSIVNEKQEKETSIVREPGAGGLSVVIWWGAGGKVGVSMSPIPPLDVTNVPPLGLIINEAGCLGIHPGPGHITSRPPASFLDLQCKL